MTSKPSPWIAAMMSRNMDPKTMTREEKVFVIALTVAESLVRNLLSIALLAYLAFVLSFWWTWLIAPVFPSAPAIGWLQMLCLRTFALAFLRVTKYPDEDEPKKVAIEDKWKRMGSSAMAWTLFLGFGWLLGQLLAR